MRKYNIHGDNIVECKRAFEYIIAGLGDLASRVEGPMESITCPSYIIHVGEDQLQFQFFPGYGERRWNHDILGFIKRSGGRLREAADAIITQVHADQEKPLAAIEFCGALPAGNQAWQRQGRAFSFAHANIPYFYVAELGGFELALGRERKAERMPNPAIPFSFLAMTAYQRSICLPVYEPNPGAIDETIKQYRPIFSKVDFLEFMKLMLLGKEVDHVASEISNKCIALIKQLAVSKKRQDGLSAIQWEAAQTAINEGHNLTEFLKEQAPLAWKKTAYIESLTRSAKQFMALGSTDSLGLTSSTLPLSFVPQESRAAFAKKVKKIYPDISVDFQAWLANSTADLAIAWVMGFKPRGDDARPDRGLPPLARMLIGNNTELLTFVYGPAPASHWKVLSQNPVNLAVSNGLWEAILAVSDAILLDSATKPKDTPRSHQKEAWAAILTEEQIPLNVQPSVLMLGEQDVDTALHVAFGGLGTETIFEGMCNPPGGDWSGISFRWASSEPEHRWLTLPRVSAEGAKRPDHVFALFGHGKHTVCLCIESKEKAGALEANIGPRLVRYAEALFEAAPSISRTEKIGPWEIFGSKWHRKDLVFISAGAYLGSQGRPFQNLPENTMLDMQIDVTFSEYGKQCILNIRGDTPKGKALAQYLASLKGWCDPIKIVLSNN